jgi:hypothetical protein
VEKDGQTDTKTVIEATSKRILDLSVGVNKADSSSGARLDADIVVGSDTGKLKFIDQNEVLVGADEDAIDGTKVRFANGGRTTGNLSGFTIQVAATDSDEDAIFPGDSFIDPVYGTFAIDFDRLANNDDRETIKIENSGDDLLTLTMTDHRGFEKTINWLYNVTLKFHPDKVFIGPVLADSGGDFIHVVENRVITKDGYAVIGNEDTGLLVEVKTITNASSGFSSDKVTLKDVFSGDTTDVSITSEGHGILNMGGGTYTVRYFKSPNGDGNITIDNQDSSGTVLDVFPTIETSKGAKMFFYQPTKIKLNISQGHSLTGESNITGLRFPDGDGYTTIAVIPEPAFTSGNSKGGWTIGGKTLFNSSDGYGRANYTLLDIGELTYNITATVVL